MAVENISPEERLFNVIQENKNPPPKNGGWEAAKIEKPTPLEGARRFFEGITRGRSGGAPAGAGPLSGLPFKSRIIDPKTINNALAGILIALLIFIVYYVINKRYNIEKITSAASRAAPPVLRPKAIEGFKPEQFYIAEVKKRDIFHPAGSGGISTIQKPPLKDMTKDFSLAGIYEGPNYSEAMIEDKAAKKTYFLKVGDEIKGIKVESILKDRVILRYGEEEIEIF